MSPESGFQIAPNWFQFGKMAITSQFSEMTWSANFFDVVLFLLSSLVTGQVSSLVLELWQFPFIRDWPEIRKLKILPSKFYPISRHWGELGIPKLVRTSLKCYWILKNARVTDFTVSELLREYQQVGGGGEKYTPPSTHPARLGLSLVTVIRFLWAMEFVI